MWLRRTSANNLLPLENAGNFLKKPLPRCPTVFELPQKSLVLIYPSVRPSIPLFHPPVHDYPRKKMYTVLWPFFSRSRKENTVLISFARVLLCLEFVYLFSAFILKNRHIFHSFKLTFRSRLVLRCCETCAETSTKSSSAINRVVWKRCSRDAYGWGVV